MGGGTANVANSFTSSSMEIICLSTKSGEIRLSAFNGTFQQCKKLSVILGVINISQTTNTTATFMECSNMKYVMLKGLKVSISMSDSPIIMKECIHYCIYNSTPSTAITITLHPDAYARLADDVDIVAALEAQPLVSLVSA